MPYLEGSEDLSHKKEWNQEAAGTKLTEQKRPEAKTDFHERKLGSSSNQDTSGGLPDSGYGKNSWPDLSLSSADKIGQGSLGTKVSKNLSELSKLSSSRGGKIANFWNYEYIVSLSMSICVCLDICLPMSFVLVFQHHCMKNNKHA